MSYSRSMFKSKPSKNRYILYARKSTESEDRQVASIESQIESMQEVANEHKLDIVEVMSEAGSGFKVGRKIFNQMLNMIEGGEADGIVAWKLSRLSRNPDDAGRIMGMLQRGQIKHIRTVERNWMPEDNVMMMSVEFGMTNQFSRDLSTDTKRGLIKKAERGWAPFAVLPLGYMHSPYKKLGDEEIIIDEPNFSMMSEALQSVASKQRTPIEAYEHLVSIGMKGKKGKPLPHSTYYDLLSHPMYSGEFEYPEGSGIIYPSKAPKAITSREYDSIMVVLGKKDKPRPKRHFIPYAGLIKCGECGCSIIGDPKHKIQLNGNTHDYMYYRCTKKRGSCAQPCTAVDKLENQYRDILASIAIPEAFHEWAITEIKKDQEKMIVDRGQTLVLQRREYDVCLKERDNLVEKYLEGKVPEDYYNRKLAELEKKSESLKSIAEGVDQRVYERLEEIDRDLAFAVTASKRFAEGDDTVKREIISYLGSNLVLTNKILDIELKRPLAQVQKIAKKIEAVSMRFEPLEKIDNKAQFMDYLTYNPVMGGRADSNRRHPPSQGGTLTN